METTTITEKKEVQALKGYIYVFRQLVERSLERIENMNIETNAEFSERMDEVEALLLEGM